MKKPWIVAGALAAVSVLISLAACTDAQMARRGAAFTDKPARVTCVTYGQVLFDGRSTGKVTYEEAGRVQFVDAANGSLTVLEGECRIVYDR